MSTKALPPPPPPHVKMENQGGGGGAGSDDTDDEEGPAAAKTADTATAMVLVDPAGVVDGEAAAATAEGKEEEVEEKEEEEEEEEDTIGDIVDVLSDSDYTALTLPQRLSALRILCEQLVSCRRVNIGLTQVRLYSSSPSLFACVNQHIFSSSAGLQRAQRPHKVGDTAASSLEPLALGLFALKLTQQQQQQQQQQHNLPLTACPRTVCPLTVCPQTRSPF
jgi:hypothetical protein